jgi:hypothetical protein
MLSPFVVAGGPCACNPDDCDFIDRSFSARRRSEHGADDLYKQCKQEGTDKKTFLIRGAD